MNAEHLTMDRQYAMIDKGGSTVEFNFGYRLGVFKGYSAEGWPRFQLSPSKESAISPDHYKGISYEERQR